MFYFCVAFGLLFLWGSGGRVSFILVPLKRTWGTWKSRIAVHSYISIQMWISRTLGLQSTAQTSKSIGWFGPSSFAPNPQIIHIGTVHGLPPVRRPFLSAVARAPQATLHLLSLCLRPDGGLKHRHTVAHTVPPGASVPRVEGPEGTQQAPPPRVPGMGPVQGIRGAVHVADHPPPPPLHRAPFEWRLAVGGGWRLVAVGGWRRLAAGGWWDLGAPPSSHTRPRRGGQGAETHTFISFLKASMRCSAYSAVHVSFGGPTMANRIRRNCNLLDSSASMREVSNCPEGVDAEALRGGLWAHGGGGLSLWGLCLKGVL